MTKNQMRQTLNLSPNDLLAIRANQLGNDLLKSWSHADALKILGTAMVKVLQSQKDTEDKV
jgi:hypothetical protein